MRWQLGIVLAVLLLPCAFSQNAYPTAIDPSSFSVIVNPLLDKIEIDQWAEFDIIVRNHQMRTRKLIYSLTEEGVEFSSLTQPTADLVAGFTLEGGSVHTTHYQLKPNRQPQTFSDRPYNLQLHITDPETNERRTVILPITVYPKGYFASQRINLSVQLIAPEKVDPRNTYSFKVDLANNNNYDIGAIAVDLSGTTVQQSFTTTLDPGERKAIDFTVSFDPQQQPMREVITIRIIRDTVVIAERRAEVEIVGYRIPFERTVQQRKQFLKTSMGITLTNRENVAEGQEVFVPASWLKRRLSRADPPTEVVTRDGETGYRWAINLEPGAQITLTITTSYRTLVLLLVLLAAAVLFWFLTKDPVAVLKYAEQYRMHEGGIVELKVVLSVKNRTRNALAHVQLVDKVPPITAVKEGEHFGTLRPHKIVHGKQGSVLRWDIDQMDAEEERIITYILKAKLSILGEIRLPPAMAIVTDGKGNKVYVKSNEADVTSQRQVRSRRE